MGIYRDTDDKETFSERLEDFAITKVTKYPRLGDLIQSLMVLAQEHGADLPVGILEDEGGYLSETDGARIMKPYVLNNDNRVGLNKMVVLGEVDRDQY